MPSPVPVSFEVYPARTPDRTPALHDTIRALAAVDPRFISVTFKAGSRSGGASLELVRFIRDEAGVRPVAHLTCVGSMPDDAAALVREFTEAGISDFLALHGDPPEDGGADPIPGELETAAEFVRLIRGIRPDAGVSVAAFPDGYPHSDRPHDRIDALLAKQAAGADVAITQLFFHADDYLGFVDEARAAGVTIPILPGIMAVTSLARLERVLELSGEDRPTDLAVALEQAPDADARRRAGVRHAAFLVQQVLAGGAPGVHLYAFNRHDTVLEVLREAGVR